MKLLLEIQDNKASFFMELIKNFRFIKAKPISAEDAVLLGEIQEAVKNMNLVNEGKLKARPAEELLNEL
jgi:hypothetical protein